MFLIIITYCSIALMFNRFYTFSNAILIFSALHFNFVLLLYNHSKGNRLNKNKINTEENIMNHFEMVEELVNKANISYQEAKDALEAADWNMLEAMLMLEKAGKVNTCCFKGRKSGSFKAGCGKFAGAVCSFIHKCNSNNFVVSRNGQALITLPITLAIIIILLACHIAIPVILISLFFGYKYSFTGPDFANCNKVNNFMAKASSVAESVTNNMRCSDTNINLNEEK